MLKSHIQIRIETKNQDRHQQSPIEVCSGCAIVTHTRKNKNSTPPLASVLDGGSILIYNAFHSVEYQIQW